MGNPEKQKKSFSLSLFFEKAGKSFVGFFVRTGKKISKGAKTFVHRFKDGSLGTKLSHFIMGSGNLMHKQIFKGLMFFFLQLAFILFMVTCPEVNNTPFGYQALINLITLGTQQGDIFTPTDNSMLMMLFGVVTVGIIVLFVIVYLSNVKSVYKADLDVRKGKKPTSLKQDIASLLDDRFHVLMLTPAMLGVLMFTVLPTVFMILIAFTNYDSDHPAGQRLFDWIGLDNFAGIFGGTGEIATRFWPVLSWTFIWAFFATFTCYIGGILLALLINKKSVKFKKLWRTVFILTIALPQFVSLLAVRNILSELGPFNNMLMYLGIIDEPFQFLAQADNVWTARITILVINIWIGVPYTMLMTSGILMNIPTDLYEAATIDGASKRQIFFNITIPYIVFVTTPYLITSFVGNITSFNVIYLLTGGAPVVYGYKAGGTDLLVTWLYKMTIDENEYSIGSVISIMTFIITASATLISYRRSKAYKEEDTFQ